MTETTRNTSDLSVELTDAERRVEKIVNLPGTKLHEMVEDMEPELDLILDPDKMKEIADNPPKTPEEFADRLGVELEAVPRILQEQMALYQNAMRRLSEAFIPPAKVGPNRQQRRARKFKHNPGSVPPGTR
jgi:hypothetical protein